MEIEGKQQIEEKFSDKEDNSIQKRKQLIKKKVFSWVNDNYDKTFLIILIAAFIIRFLIFLKTMNQPLWWDAGDYLATAKRVGLGLDIRDMWYYRRGFFWALFSATFFKIGLGELTIRFTEVIFSTGIVFVSYFLIKDMFNKKYALGVSIALTLSWIILFFTGRPLTSIPATFFLLSSLYFFWKAYILKKGNKYFYLFAIFYSLAVLTRMQYLMFAPSFLIIIFLREKMKFLKNKRLWISLAIIILFFMPYFYLSSNHYDENPISNLYTYYFGAEKRAEHVAYEREFTQIFQYFKDLPYMLTGKVNLNAIDSLLIFGIFLFGIISFSIILLLGFDKIFEDPRIQKRIFVLSWVIIPFFALGYMAPHVEQRYIIPCLPFLFLIFLFGLFKLGNYATDYFKINKKTASVILIILLIVLFIPNLNFGNSLIENKKTSYIQVMQAGLWIKENSNPGDIIISSSVPQLTYYAEKSVYNFDHFGKNESDFDSAIAELKPRYLVISALEQSEEWAYSYPQKHNDTLIPVQLYKIQENPVLVIYEFNWGNSFQN